MWAPRGRWSSSVCAPRGPATEPGSQRSSEVFAESIASQAEESGQESWMAFCRPKPFISFNPQNSHMTYTSSSTFPKSEDCHVTGGARSQAVNPEPARSASPLISDVRGVWTGAAFLRVVQPCIGTALRTFIPLIPESGSQICPKAYLHHCSYSDA